MMRSPVSLSRLRFTPGSPEVVYLHKGGHDDIEPTEGERMDAMEFMARVLAQIPGARRHLRLLDHLRKREKVARPPPHAPQPLASPV